MKLISIALFSCQLLKRALEELIAASATFTPTNRYRQEIEAETALRREEKERERDRKAKLANRGRASNCRFRTLERA